MGSIIPLHPDPHEETQLLLPWYLTGKADAAALARVARHLGDCAECRDDLAYERKLHAALANHEPLLEPVTAPATAKSPPRYWGAFGRAAAAVVFLAALLPGNPRQTAPYRALGSSSASAAGNILVMYQPGTHERDLRQSMKRSGAHLVAGPTAAGAYVLQVPPDARDSALARLRADAAVSLAEPIDSGQRR